MRINTGFALRAMLTVAVVSVLFNAPPTQAQEQIDDVDTSVVHTYVVEPDQERVVVSTKMAVTADKPNRSTGRGVTQFYFTGWYVTIPGEAIELTVTDNGRDLVYERIEAGDFSELDITFRRNIFYRETANIEIRYVLPSDGPRNDAVVQVNPAYAGFGVYDGTGAEEVGFTIEFPPGFGENEGFGLESLERRVEDDGRVIFENLEVPLYETVFGFVAAANTDSLRSESFEVDDKDFELRAWPGDTKWSSFVRDQITEGTPLLTDMTGLEWPVDDVLEITESYSPYLNGYGGWYDPEDTSIEIGDELDGHLIFHELGHVWFNDGLFTDRWITEGLADEFADTLMEDLDGERRDPPKASNLDDNAIALSQWTGAVSSFETEEWAYEASWKVMNEIAEQVGIEGLGSVIGAADEGRSAYPGETDFTTGARRTHDWRYFLDLLEMDMSPSNDDLSELFADWVVSDSISYQLDDRLEARTTYAELVNDGGEWAPPAGVRAALSEWKFSASEPLLASAAAQIDLRDQVVGAAAEVDVEFPDGYESDYEQAETIEDLEKVGQDLAKLKASAQQLVAAHDLSKADPAFFTKVGLIGEDLDAEFIKIGAAFEANELEEVAQGADQLEETLTDAESTGKLRVGIAAAILAILMLLVFGLLYRRQKNKKLTPTVLEVVRREPAVTGEQAAQDLTPVGAGRPEIPKSLPWDPGSEPAAPERPSPPDPGGLPPRPSHRAEGTP